MPGTAITEETELGVARSVIACHVCRRRKVKCNREIPHCTSCKQTSQQCEYPSKVLKPGPQMGSKIPRKRQAQQDPEQYQHQEMRRKMSSISQHDQIPRTQSDQSSSPSVISMVSSSPRRRPKDIQSLSFIIHPSHESCSPEKLNDSSSPNLNADQKENVVLLCCVSLRLNPDHLDQLVKRYFETFTSFQLFRQNDICAILDTVRTVTQGKAVLAAILAFATKDSDLPGASSTLEDSGNLGEQEPLSSSHLGDLAMKYVDLAINECEDNPLSLPLLQALVLLTHWLLIQGVRGRAWRYLGLCIKSAYELNLHLIDAGRTPEDNQIDSSQWCDDEERRRVWWAIWEMDVFASVIRRCPTGIDWSQNETFLPAEDEKWLRGEPQHSCILEPNLTDRRKSLETTGNQSPKAWFILINSLMKDAQKISSPIGINKKTSLSSQHSTKTSDDHRDIRRRRENAGVKEALARLCTVLNSLYCTVISLPQALRYHNQYLDFGTRGVDQYSVLSRRLLHSSIFGIHLMAQLTKLMIYKYFIFRVGIKRPPMFTESRYSRGHVEEGASFQNDLSTMPSATAETTALEQYSEAADEIVAIVRRSSECYYKYVNPFLANTVWLAGAVQLVYRELAPSDKDLISSNFELLSMSYNRFVSYWGMSTALQKNLEVVENELENLQGELQSGEMGCEGLQDSGDNVRGMKSRKENDRSVPIGRRGAEDSNTDKTVPNSMTNSWHDSTQKSCVRSSNFQNCSTPADSAQNNSPSADLSKPGPEASMGDLSIPQHQQQLHQDNQSSCQGSILNPMSTVFPLQALPTISQSILPNSNRSLGNLVTAETQYPMSPNFLDAWTFSHDLSTPNIDLSNYLDEMLSGSYMSH